MFGIFAKSYKPTHCPSFAKEPKYARIFYYWRYFDFQIKPKMLIFGKNWACYD